MQVDPAEKETPACAVQGPATPARRARLKTPDLQLPFWLFTATTATVTLFQLQQVLIPQQIEAIDPSQKVANLAFITGVFSIASMFGGVAGGIVSDHTVTRWGRRAPSIAISGLVCALILLWVAAQHDLAPLTIGYSVLWFAGSYYTGALAAALPDRVPENRRGFVSSLMGFGIPLGIMIGVNISVHVPGIGAYILYAAFLLVATVGFLYFAREGPAAARTKSVVTSSPLTVRGILNMMSAPVRAFRHRDFALAFVSRALMFAAFYAINNYTYYIVQDFIGPDRVPYGSVAGAVGVLNTIQTVAWMISIAPCGWLADRLDRRKFLVGLCAIGLALAAFIPFLFQSWLALVIFEVCFGVFLGAYIAVDLALLSLVLPDKKNAGGDLAMLYTMGGAAPQILTPMIAGAIISQLGYGALFIFASVAAMASGIVVLYIRSVR